MSDFIDNTDEMNVFNMSVYPDNRNEYCIYFLSWSDKNKYDISFSCGRRIFGISKYTNLFKQLDSGASKCKCGRIASQGELE